MPIYLYRCRHCGHKVEMLRAMNERDSELACPQCGTKEMEKVFLPFYGGLPRSSGGGFNFG